MHQDTTTRSHPTAVSTTTPFRLAILECDTPLPVTQARYESYGGVFRALLRAGVNALSVHDEENLELDISTWDVVHEPEKYPDPETVDGVLMTGSRFSAYDNDAWILTLVSFVKRVISLNSPSSTSSATIDGAKTRAKVKIIGVCFGHQIVGRALGLPVERNSLGWEVSVSRVDLSDVGRRVFRKDNLNIQQMHRDIVIDPSHGGSSLSAHDLSMANLGSSPLCSLQGIYAPAQGLLTIQGHPEFNEGIMQEILETRHRAEIIDDKTFENAMRRVGKEHDGVAVAVAFLRFLFGREI
ncbi:MAG: hypothetical protein M1826_007025 [Phylliscum demangeonii]|nr:MAG: hypothetical protein M1826_007025 [Phylliscum demangeonii]